LVGGVGHILNGKQGVIFLSLLIVHGRDHGLLGLVPSLSDRAGNQVLVKF